MTIARKLADLGYVIEFSRTYSNGISCGQVQVWIPGVHEDSQVWGYARIASDGQWSWKLFRDGELHYSCYRLASQTEALKALCRSIIAHNGSTTP